MCEVIRLISKADYNELAKYKTGTVAAEIADSSPRTAHLIDQKLIETDELDAICYSPYDVQVCASAYRLTPAGENALAEFEQRCKEKAQAERQRRFQNKVSVASVLVPVITFVVGLLVEYCSGIADSAFRLFGEWVKNLVH